MPASSSAPPPKVSDRYEIKDPAIGRGGMGVVYKAYDNKTRRFVALKTISGEVDPAALDLFEREWNVLARISHPNIVDILDTGEYAENGHRMPFFVMPLLPGVTLESLIKTSNQRLTVERTVEIICQACRGLQAAHDQGLVHRDIKPSNIFVMDDDTVKIIDFGVVHLADTRTVTGLKGTPLYMAPEQLEGKPATALSDIFSLSVVSYEALTGRKPFARSNEGDLFDAVRTFIPPAASEINPAVNQLISRTVHKGMAKQPWHRFSSAREYAETLQKALRNEAIERFDRAKIQPRIERIKKAQAEGDYQFATEILTELESEGHMDPEMSMLRLQLDQAVRTKTIRQLLDSARTRMEEDEYPLALQKIQDVLNLDPNNLDATTMRRQIERQRGAQQLENWFRIVAQHLDNHDYRQARQALQEILKIDSAEPRARELLSRLDRTEQELSKSREEKQKLYEAAVASYRNGEISTALTKLERLLEMNRAAGKSATTDRDAQYQSLYNQIRSERESARNLYAEGRKYLADKNFAKALEICEEYLRKQPGDPLFQALKLEAEEVQRQDHSAVIADVSRRVEADADLDKKFNIVQEAVQRYPAEPQFKTMLKLLKDRRELVNSIVARAGQYEERGQLNDAAAQWDILRNIYPAYPGLELELQRLSRRREDQVTEEAKARWVERIDRHITAGEYAKARELVKQALAEFPNDQELRGLDSLAEQALRRSDEAATLLREGRRLIQENRFEDGIQVLRKAERLDERNPAARTGLIGALLQRARELMSSDWHAAEPLVNEVLQLEPADPVARSLTSLIADYKRQEAVSKFLGDARKLQAAGNLEGALAQVEKGLQAFPNESRLVQLQHTLRGAVPDNRKKDTPPPAPPTPAPATPEPASATMLMSPVGRAATPTAKAPTAPPPPVQPPPPPKPVAAKPEPPKATPAPAPKASDKKRLRLIIGAAAAAVLLIVAGILFTRHGTKTPPPPPPSGEIPIALSANVPGVRYLMDGRPVSGTQASARPGSTHRFEAEADGYVGDPQNFTIPSNATKAVPLAFEMHPALAGIRINSDLAGAKLFFDQQAPVNLQDGIISKDDIQPGTHHVVIRSAANSVLFDFAFDAKPAAVPTISAPPKGTVPGVIVASLGPNAIVYGTPGLTGGVEGQSAAPIPADGQKLTLPSQTGLRYVVDEGKGKTHTVGIDVTALPALNVTLSGAAETFAFTVTANIPDAVAVVNNREVKTHLVNGTLTLHRPAGKYHVLVKADDYEPASEQVIELKSGDTPQPLNFTLNRIAHAATLAVESAPSDTEVLIDGTSIGTAASGALSKEVSPGNHTVTLKKPNYEDYVHYQQFTAGKTVTISGAEMKPYGKLLVKVTPAAAHVTYKRAGETQEKSAQNNQDHSIPAGDYIVKAEADGFFMEQENVTIAPGKEVSYTVSLKPTAVAIEKIVPSKIFANGASWTSDSSGWWTYAQKGFSFTKADEGTLNFTLLKDNKAFLKEKRNKYEFVADYKDEDNKILYTLDPHHLTRKVFVDSKEVKDQKTETPLTVGDYYRMTVQITPDSITLHVNGATDVIKRSQTRGKFGFMNEVVLSPR